MKKSSPIMNENGPGLCPAPHPPLLVVAIISPPLNEDETLLVEGDSAQLLGVDRPPVSSRRSFAGGAGWHMAMALGRLDHRASISAFFPVNGSPQRPDHFLQDLESAGIDTSHVRCWSRPMSRNIVVEFLGDGRRMIFRDPARASASVHLYDIDGLATADLILVAGSVDEEVVEEVRKRAERLNIPWCWNPATSHFPFLADVVSTSTQLKLIQLNDLETATYAGLPLGAPPAELLASVSGLVGGKAFVLTCGAGGSLGISGLGEAGLLSCPAPRLPSGTPIVGLGDKHFALVAYAFHRSGNLPQAMHWAAANLR